MSNKKIVSEGSHEQVYPCLRICTAFLCNEETAQQASEIIEGILTARSPRLSEIAARMPGEEAACYKRIQRFLQSADLQEAVKLQFNEEADFVIGGPIEIERPHANRTGYVGTLKDG